MERLISAEALKKALIEKYDALFREDGDLLYSDHVVTGDDAKDLVEFINEQPTAYDPERVVEQLEELRKTNYEAWEAATYIPDKIGYISAANAYANAIEIVKEVR